MASARRELTALARLYGVQTSYEDVGGVRRHASPEALFLTLRALGAPIESPAAAAGALEHRRRELEATVTEPVHVAWDGRLAGIRVRVDPRSTRAPAQLTLRAESGETRIWKAPFEPGGRNVAGTCRLRVPGRLPIGYHTVEIETRGGTHRTRILSAPRRMYAPAGESSWGVFAPLYALRPEPDAGIADYTHLAQLARWTGAQGGSWLGTLPLLAAFVDRPYEPSPYSPVSRLFWNELYVAAPELPEATSRPALPVDPHRVDYRTAAHRRRAAVQAAARAFFESRAGPEHAAFEQFVAAQARLADYARFRAVCDRTGTGWHSWPARLRDGELRPEDFDRRDEQYYLFAQWQADRQLAAIGTAAGAGSASLYLDLPLGVNPDGYDAWRFRDVFVAGASAGAPPDALFTGGQDWGFRPLSPAQLRATGYEYLIESLRHHLRHARLLRLDHVMWLYRLYWIPAGLNAREGVYVQYPADELLAVLAIESARQHAGIVGEDLGTVPRVVREGMARHQLQHLYVVQYELQPDGHEPLTPVPREAVASLNTHDMPPFGGFLAGGDIDDQIDLGLVDAAEARAARVRRALLVRRLAEYFGTGDDAHALLRALLRHLAASDARTVLVNLEDLWLEVEPQNVPGTSSERPNWQRRHARTLEELMSDPTIVAVLGEIGALRSAPAAAAPAIE